MRRLLVVLLSATLIVFGLTALAMAGSTPGSGIKGSYHDLSSSGLSSTWGDAVEQAGQNRVCVYCHTPHHALKASVAATATPNSTNYVPLWNHALTTTATWTPYTPGTDLPMAGTAKFPDSTLDNTTPGSVSILCLSCHDGSVAVNEYGFAPASADERRRGAAVKFSSTDRAAIGFGGDLSNHHPIGFDYTAVCKTGTGCTGNDDEIADPDTPVPGLSGMTISGLLWNNRMQCSSCHDVHNTKAQGVKLTWVSDTQSGLCLTCHLKNQ